MKEPIFGSDSVGPNRSAATASMKVKTGVRQRGGGRTSGHLSQECSQVQCPVCQNRDVVPSFLLQDRFFETVPDSFQLFRCHGCGLLFQEEEAVVERIPDFYPAGYWWRETGPISGLERRYREWVLRWDQVGFVKKVAAGLPEPTLLDVGCGSGTFIRLARQAGFDVFGLDRSALAIESIQGIPPERLHAGCLEDLVERGLRFDIITLFHTLEHVPDPLEYVRRLRRLLKSPGRLVLQVPNIESIQARLLGRRWYGLDCPRHLHNFGSRSLQILLEKAGFRLEAVRYFSLRDNAAALVSSLFPGLDPMSQRVKLLRSRGRTHTTGLLLKEVLYLGLFVLAQPLALLEAALKRGGTVTVCAAV